MCKSSLNKDIVCNEVWTPTVIAVSEIDDWALDEIAVIWSAIDAC